MIAFDVKWIHVYNYWSLYGNKLLKINMLITFKTISLRFLVRIPVSRIVYGYIYPFCHLKYKDPFAPFHFSHRSIWVSVTVFDLYDYVVCEQGEVTCVWYQNGMSWWHLHVCTRPRYCRITYNVTGNSCCVHTTCGNYGDTSSVSSLFSVFFICYN